MKLQFYESENVYFGLWNVTIHLSRLIPARFAGCLLKRGGVLCFLGLHEGEEERRTRGGDQSGSCEVHESSYSEGQGTFRDST